MSDKFLKVTDGLQLAGKYPRTAEYDAARGPAFQYRHADSGCAVRGDILRQYRSQRLETGGFNERVDAFKRQLIVETLEEEQLGPEKSRRGPAAQAVDAL